MSQVLSGFSDFLLNEVRQSRAILAVSLGIGLLFYWCFWNQMPGLSIGYFFVATTAMCWLLLRLSGREWPVWLWIVVAVMAFLVAMLIWRASTLMAVLNLFTLFCLGMAMVRLLREPVWWMPLSSIMDTILLPFAWIRPFFAVMSRALSSERHVSAERSAAVVRGVVVTVPIVLVLLLLFIKSDMLLQTVFGNLFTWTLSEETIMSWVVIGIVAVWFAGALSFIIRQGTLRSVMMEDKRWLGLIESRILLIGVNAAFGLFVLAQFAYLFGGEAYLDHTAVSYADYARQGFGELVAVAIVAAGVLGLAKPHLWQKESVLVRNLGLLLGGQVLIVLGSAMNRLWLYEQAYGFTVARLVGQTFMIWLAVVFMVLLAQIWGKLSAKQVGSIVIGLVVATVVGLNLLNPDAFIARQNVARYNAIGKIDLRYLGNLSGDAVPALLPLLTSTDADFKNAAARMLSNHLRSAQFSLANSQGDWRSWNWGRYHGMQLLEDRASDLEYDRTAPVVDPVWEY